MRRWAMMDDFFSLPTHFAWGSDRSDGKDGAANDLKLR